jgi:sugar-specific transcriptional regulator TrmB
MDDLGEAIARLSERMDFGEYEIEAYLAVLDHGELTASEVAEVTDIPQPRVYDTVRTLADRGLVELRESRPMRVVALDPEEAFPPVRQSLDELVADLEERFTRPARQREAVSLVKSRSTILRHLGDVIENAEYELVLSLTPGLMERFEDPLADALDRGVATELLLAPAADAAAPDEYDYTRVATEVRARRGITTPVIAVADGNASVYATQDALTGSDDRYGVIFNRSALGFLVSGFFNTVLWTTAETLLPDGAASFPRRYASIRRCLKDIGDAPGSYVVHIEGRDVETGEARTVEGRVTDTALDATAEVATMTVETGEGPVTVGGRVAAFEDVEAHEIHVRQA